MDDRGDVDVTLELQEGYRFLVDFHQAGVDPTVMDEPPPLGEATGPNAVRMLAAAIGHCLSASAIYCLTKARVPVSGMSTRVRVALVRNPQGRLRVGQVRVELQPRVPAGALDRLDRCLRLFEDYCVVTQSVRSGVEVSVEVRPEMAEAGAALASRA